MPLICFSQQIVPHLKEFWEFYPDQTCQKPTFPLPGQPFFPGNISLFFQCFQSTRRCFITAIAKFQHLLAKDYSWTKLSMISLLSQSVFLLGKCICLLSALVPLEELWAKLIFCSWSCFIPLSINSIKPSGNGNNLGFDGLCTMIQCMSDSLATGIFFGRSCPAYRRIYLLYLGGFWINPANSSKLG